MKYHVIIGVTAPFNECRFCGRHLRILSTDETHVKMQFAESIHFSLTEHFYGKCHRCGLSVHWNLLPAHAALPNSARRLAHYLRQHLSAPANSTA